MPAGESARAMANKLRTDAERLRTEAEFWDLGADGEERVGALLDGADRQTTRVLHDRLLSPGDSAANLDHVFVSPAGIFLIDAKNWAGGVTVRDGALWQHTSGAEGSRSKNREVQVVRATAAKMSKIVGRTVTPVLCLAGAGAGRFGAPDTVDGVHIVPIVTLLDWLADLPAVLRPDEVASLAVELSVQFPPAVGGGLTLHELVEPTLAIKPRKHRGRRAHRVYPGPPGTGGTSRTTPSFPVRLVVLLVVGIAAFVVGSRALNALTQGAANALTHTSPAAQPSVTLTAKQLQALDDWRIRAGLYRDNDRPSTLAYVADSGLGSYSTACRTQEQKLAAYRRGLLQAPDPALATAAKRFDTATHQYLEACRLNHPVALHHAEGAMSVAASEVNVRYNRLLGKDPTSYAAIRVL